MDELYDNPMDALGGESNHIKNGTGHYALELFSDNNIVDDVNRVNNHTYFGDTDNFIQGNSDMIISYADPLMHSSEFQADPFFFSEESAEKVLSNVYEDSVNITLNNGFDNVGYTIDVNGGLMPDISDINRIPGVENGMLTDLSQLNNLISLGELQGTQHIDNSDVICNESVKMEFLHQNGYTDLPAGYKIHYIIPLNEGGADNPRNMILVQDIDYDKITKAHHIFYGR